MGILVFGGVSKVVQDLKRGELRTREKLLRLEFQFAELTKKLQSRRDQGITGFSHMITSAKAKTWRE